MCRKRAVKEDLEYGMPVKMMEPEARNIDRGGNLLTEVGGVGAKSDRRRLVAWDGVRGADSCVSCTSEEGREKEGEERIERIEEDRKERALEVDIRPPF